MSYKNELQNNNVDLRSILDAVNALPDATETVIEPLEVTENGTYTAPDGVDGYNPVTVNVPIPDGYIIPAGSLEITENGTHDVTEYASVDVNVASTGGNVPVEEKDVNFFDYDGTLLYSYTLDEVQGMTELPRPPEHENLVVYGWNWTLQRLKDLGREMDVGAIYNTDDGATHLVIRNDTKWTLQVPIHWYQEGANDVTVDFGDGSPTETVGSTGYVSVTHTYPPGEYTIKLHISSDKLMRLGGGANYTVIGGNNKALNRLLVAVRMGAYVSRLSGYAFANCTQLETVTFASRSVAFDGANFNNCTKLKFVVLTSSYAANPFNGIRSVKRISPYYNTNTLGNYFLTNSGVEKFYFPEGATATGTQFAYQADCLSKIVLPNSLTTISQQSFLNCKSLYEIVIPANVSSIAAQAFSGAQAMMLIKFLPTTPPTVANANAFTSLPTDCVIEVPKGTLATYQAATNYSGISAQMVEAD